MPVNLVELARRGRKPETDLVSLARGGRASEPDPRTTPPPYKFTLPDIETEAERGTREVEEEAERRLAVERKEFEEGKTLPTVYQSPMMGMNPAAFTPPSKAVEAITGVNPVRAKAGIEAATDPEAPVAKRSAGAITAAGEAVPLLLTAVTGALGKGAQAAYKAGGLPALAKYGGAMGAEIAVGSGAEHVARKGLEKMGLDENTAAILAGGGTLPITAAGMAKTGKAIIRNARKASGVKKPPATPKPKAPEPVIRGQEPVPGVEITTAGRPEGVVRSQTPEADVRPLRAAAVGEDLERIARELVDNPPVDETGVRAYQDELDRLVELREQSLAVDEPVALPEGAPAPRGMVRSGTQEMSRREAREAAREIEASLAELGDTMDPTARAIQESRLADLRKYGGPDDEQIQAALFPENLADETPGKLPSDTPMAERDALYERAAENRARIQKKLDDIRRAIRMQEGRLGKAMRTFGPEESDEVVLGYGESQVPTQLTPSDVNRFEPRPGDLSPEATGAEDILFDYGPSGPAGRDSIPDITMEGVAPRQSDLPLFTGEPEDILITGNAKIDGIRKAINTLRTRLAAATDPGQADELMLQIRALESEAERLGTPVDTAQTTLRSDEPQELFDQNPDITVRPERPLYTRELSDIEAVDPGTQAVLRPSEETLELNYPGVRARGERFAAAKARAEKAQQDIRGLRERLANRDLSPEQRTSLEERIAKLEKQTAEDPALKEWAKAGEAMAEGAPRSRKSFLDFLADAGKRPKKAAVPEAEHLGAGNLPAKKWVGPKDVADRLFRRDTTSMLAKQLTARVRSLQAQADDFAARGIENARVTEALDQARAELYRVQAREIGDAQARTLIDKYAEPKAKPGGGKPDAREPRAPEAAGAAETAETRTLDQKIGGLTDAVRRILYDSDWAFRNMEVPSSAAGSGDKSRARALLADISGRFKEVKALTATRAARDFSRVWMIDRDKKIGLRYLSPEESRSLFYTLDRNAEPLNDHVDLVATELRAVFDDLASEFEAMGGLTYDLAQKAWRPFARKLDYVFHLTPNTRMLRDDKATRARVKDFMLQTHGIEERAADQMIDEYVHLMLKGEIGQEATLAHWLVDSGQTRDLTEAHALLSRYAEPKVRRSGSLEYSRTFNLPFVDTDIQSSLHGWLEHTWRRMTWIEKFGQEIPSKAKVVGEKQRPMKLADIANAEEDQIYESMSTLSEMLDELEAAGGKQLSSEAARRLNTALENQTEDKTWAAISRTLRSLSMFKLSYLGAENMFQGVLGSTLRGDLASTLKGLTKSFSDEALRVAEQSGSRPIEGLEEAAMHPIYFGGEDFSMMKFQKAISAWMNITQVKRTENFNRTITPASAAEYIDSLYRTIDEAPEASTFAGFTRDDAKFAASELERLNLPINRRPTDEEMLKSLFVFDREVNFEVDPWLRPEWSNSLWGRHVTQFWNWSYQQTRLVWQETYGMLARGVKTKDANALARGLRNTIILTTLYPAAGMTARALRTVMKTAVGTAGAAVGQGLGARTKDPTYLEDYTTELEETPGLTYFRAGSRLGAFTALADPVESLWVRGQFPDSPSMYGDLTYDMFDEIFLQSLEATTKEFGKQAARPFGGDYVKPFRVGGATAMEGVTQSLAPLPELTVPATQPLRELIRGEREPQR